MDGYSSTINHPQTTVGYMPKIQAPAHEMVCNGHTVIHRCMYTPTELGQEYTVITADQALFCKIMELRWSIPEYGEKLVMRLGGLQISMNSLKVIVQHMKCSSLVEGWVESGILGPDSADNVMTGKSYNRGMIVQKLTFQATWKILYPQFCTLLQMTCAVILHKWSMTMMSFQTL